MLKEVDRALKKDGKRIKKKLKKETDERCIHRHSKDTHPNCFRRGLLKKLRWYEEQDLSIAFLDIETTGLKANIGFMLSWSLKYRDGPLKSDIVNRDEIFEGKYDKRIVKNLLDELRNVDIIVTYYGTRFDLPYFRSRALYWNFLFPAYGSVFHFDLYYRVRSLLKLHRHSLDAVTRFFGIEGKTPIDISVWNEAQYGNRKALKKVMEHNDADVIILEELFDKLEDYSKWTRRSL
jgi:uncharacterized protein YprB with RNaseH-like and TPR domain